MRLSHIYSLARRVKGNATINAQGIIKIKCDGFTIRIKKSPIPNFETYALLLSQPRDFSFAFCKYSDAFATLNTSKAEARKLISSHIKHFKFLEFLNSGGKSKTNAQIS